ncbi:ATP-binding cassette domain-containing protein [Bradyrhizobium sp. 186]|nr:ATP-binding cassette domain-containing protein [Bradyrhizobium sp. 186]
MQVLKDISRDVEQGRVTTLPGSSGSGKSTFLCCLN